MNIFHKKITVKIDIVRDFSFAKIFVLLFLLFPLLSGCGFSPIYASGDEDSRTVKQSLSNIAIANIPDRHGQILRNHLIDRMYFDGRPSYPDSTLEISLRSSQKDLGVQKDASTFRRQLDLWADYTLRARNGKQLLKGTAHSAVGYSKLDAQFGTVAAEQNAMDRALKEVGEQIVNRLALYYAEN